MLILPNFLSLLKDRWFIMTHSDQQERQRYIHPIHSYASSRPVDYIWTRNLAKSGWRTRGGDCPDLQRWKPSSGNAYRTNKVKTVIDEIWVNFYCHLYTHLKLFFVKVLTVRLAQIPAPDSSVVRATDQRFSGPRCRDCNRGLVRRFISYLVAKAKPCHRESMVGHCLTTTLAHPPDGQITCLVYLFYLSNRSHLHSNQ